MWRSGRRNADSSRSGRQRVEARAYGRLDGLGRRIEARVAEGRVWCYEHRAGRGTVWEYGRSTGRSSMCGRDRAANRS